MTKIQKRVLKCSIAFAAVFAVYPVANAMHIMEGYLSPSFCIAWGVVCVPFLVMGMFKIRKMFSENRKAITLLAMAGAYIFVLSALKIPSVTGSCSHMTGTGLGAILFGPSIVSILGVIVLLFGSFGIYALCRKRKVNKMVSIFMAAARGELFPYCVTSIQLALAYPSAQGGVAASALEFLGVFAPTQLPLAIVEGLLTVMIMMALQNYAKSELKAIGFEKAA